MIFAVKRPKYYDEKMEKSIADAGVILHKRKILKLHNKFSERAGNINLED